MNRSRISWLVVSLTAVAVIGLIAVGLARGKSANVKPTQVSQVEIRSTLSRPVSKTDQLVAKYQQVIRTSPDNAESGAMLGAAYYQKARETGDPSYYVRAEAVLREALKSDPSNVDALVMSGTLENARHQFRAALAVAERARALNRWKPGIYGVIADAQTELGRYDAAAATLQTMVDLRPDMSSYSRISYARELHGDTVGAIDAMQQAVIAGGPAAENNAWARVQLAHLYFAKGDLRHAERQYAQTLAEVPNYVYAMAGLARVRTAQGRLDEAAALYHKAIDRLPMPEFVIGLGELEQMRGRSSSARQQYDLVGVMQQLNLHAGIDVDMELALFDADHGIDPKANVVRARAAYSRRPSLYAADALGWAYYRAGSFTQAHRYSKEALRLGTQDAMLYFHAGMIAAAVHDRATALDELRTALAINPFFSPLQVIETRRVLARLEHDQGSARP